MWIAIAAIKESHPHRNIEIICSEEHMSVRRL